MANQVENQLTDELLPLLRKERFVTLSTVDHEKGTPNVHAISWIYAKDEKALLLAVDNRSRIVQNVKKTSGVALTLIANGSTYSIVGKGTILHEKLENVPLKLAAILVHIEEVRDVMFYGAKIVTEPTYDKTYDIDAAAKLDRQVMAALQNA